MILNGVIHTMEGKTIDSGYIRVENGKIQQVGRMDQLPNGVELGDAVDARGGHILPGLMDIHCHLGLCGCDGEDLNETSQVCTPNIRVLDGVNPMDPYVKEARGKGLLVGCEYEIPIAVEVKHKVLERRALITAIGDRVNRMIPPLTVTKKEVDQLIRIMKASILEAAEEYQGMKMAG